MPRIFVSHASADNPFAIQLADALSNAQVDVWLDLRNIQAGERWNAAIQRGLNECDAMVVIMSPAAMASKNVEDEWQYYTDKRKPIYPILYQQTDIPYQLVRYQYINFAALPFDDALGRLLAALGIDSSSPRSKALETLQKAFQAWQTLDQKPALLLDGAALDATAPLLLDPSLDDPHLAYLLWSIAQKAASSPYADAARNLIGQLDAARRATLIDHLMGHSLAAIREGVVRLAAPHAPDVLLAHLAHETDSDVKAAIISSVPLSTDAADRLLREETDWLVLSRALAAAQTRTRAALLIPDGTAFAETLGALATNAGYKVVSVLPHTDPAYLRPLQQIALRQISDEILAQYELVILVRGEHFSDAADNPQLYGSLKRYVENGGSLLMTSWVAWELKASPAFGGELPFIFSGKFKEDVEIEARVTDHELAAAIFEPNIRYTAPLEYGLAHHQAAVLLETTNGDPLFAFRRVEKGTQAGFYYYLNCCQHSCRQPDIASPLSTSPQLHRSMERLLAWIWSRGY